MSFTHPARTTLASLFAAEPSPVPWRRGLQLSSEALIFTAISTYLPVVLGFSEAGLISVFLISASLGDRLALLLEENRNDIYLHGRGPWRANRRTAWSLFCVFFGILVGYALVAATLGEGGTQRLFGFTIEAANLREDTLLDRSFGDPVLLFANNALVLVSVLFLALIYRSYGAMLAVSWNACIWAFVLTLLAQRAFETTEMAAPAFFGVAAAALLPHLALEALAYVLGALAAIFMSKALTTYSLNDPVVREVSRVAASIIGIALLVLVAAAIVEARYAPAVLRTLGDDARAAVVAPVPSES